MRNYLISMCIALVVLVGNAFALEPKQQLPELGIPELNQAKGEFIYIDFWASWCGPCRQSFPWMNKLQNRYMQENLKVVAINLDAKRNDADKFLAQVPANFSVVFDVKANTAKKLAIKAMPTSLLVNPQGQVVWIHTGFRAEDAPLLERRIEQAMQSKKIDKSTKLIGE